MRALHRTFQTLKKNLYRKQGKGRRCCLFFRASYFALGPIEEQDELHQNDLKKGMISFYLVFLKSARN